MLVASTFVENPNNHNLLRFKDGNKLNLNKNNLEWTDNPYDSKENWVKMKNFDQYEICQTGIRNIETKIELIIQNVDDSKEAYPTIMLTDNHGKRNVEYIHVLMAVQYIPNPNNLPQVNHIDGNRNNFNIDNLEWVTRSENSQHAVDTGLTTYDNRGKRYEILDENNNVIETLISKKKLVAYVGKNVETKNKFEGVKIVNGYRIRNKIYEDLEGEIWKNVNTRTNYIDENYQVSNFGKVRHINSSKPLSYFEKDKYRRVSLSNGEKGMKFYIHRLVAFTFLEFQGEMKDYQVNHIDKDPSNNNLENLEILSTKDHIIKDQGDKILGLSENSEYVIFPSCSKAGEILSFHHSGIKKSMERGGTCGGYTWYYLESEEAQNIISTCKIEITRVDKSKKILEALKVPEIKIIPDKCLGLSDKFEYVTFQTHKKAGQHISLDPSGIGKAMERNGVCGRYKWYNLESEEAQSIMLKYNREPQKIIKKKLKLNIIDTTSTTSTTSMRRIRLIIIDD